MAGKPKLKISARLLRKKVRRGGASTSFNTKRQCRFSENPEAASCIDYKNVAFLKTFLTERGKILPSRISGNSAYYQRKLACEIKLARIMALLPFSTYH
jgi:small subunit ribosomal protein S18